MSREVVARRSGDYQSDEFTFRRLYRKMISDVRCLRDYVSFEVDVGNVISLDESSRDSARLIV